MYPVYTARQLLTDSAGVNARLRVDVGQTGFFAGREFRTFKEFDVATTSTYVIKIEVPVNTILFEFGLGIEAGSIRIETMRSGGTVVEGGSFSETLPRIPTNTMTEKPQPPYAVQNVLTAGGTLTGGSVAEGTIIDVLRAKAADNSNFAASVGAEAGAERGVSPATYYWRATLAGFIGVISARWEERP
ncbi:hypothetical protein MNJPNG_04930 [Cupriavidus oxalaticus]|uniref:hypothetical protein n=1 Tax=Cupriavidus oxalaticus TaxID=96344 RepID=UPI003F740886